MEANIKPLNFTSKAYMDAFVNFRLNVTNQGDLILHFLQEKLKTHISDNKLDKLRLASIGSGTGVIDAPLCEILSGICPIDYLGIEPNEHEIAIQAERMGETDSENLTTEFSALTLEEYDFPADALPYDAMIAVHVTYYSADIAPMIDKALRMLHPTHGVLLTAVSANTPQNELFMETTQAISGYTPFLSKQYTSLLEQMGVAYSVETVEAAINIGDLLDQPDSPQGKQFLDFFLHADSSSIPPEDRARYISILQDQTVEKNGKPVLPHIVDIVSVQPK